MEGREGRKKEGRGWGEGGTNRDDFVCLSSTVKSSVTIYFRKSKQKYMT